MFLYFQMTIPSLLSMYGVVLGYINENDDNFYLWSEQIILTPILFTAFYNIAGKLKV